MKRYFLYSIAVVLLVALVWLRCSKDQSSLAPDAGQQPQVAAKILEDPRVVEGIISVERLKAPLFATLRDGRVVERRVNIFYKSGGVGRGGKGGGKKCYTFFAAGARWKTTEPYVLDTTNGDRLRKKFVASMIRKSLNTWDEQVKFNIFGPRDTESRVDGVDEEWPDEKNEILFGDIDDPDIIAITIVWGIFSGPLRDRELVEWDTMLNDYFTWGNAGPTDETGLGNIDVMDLQNIVTHEAGHAAGLDHPSDDCTEETMYPFAENGETKKRTLHTGDIAGIKKLYKGKGK